VLSTRSVSRSYEEGNWGQPSQLIVRSQFCTGLEHGSRRIIIVRSRYQETSSEGTTEKISIVRNRCHETSSEDTAGWKSLSRRYVKCGD
jgi:hypothetical protein